MLYQPFQHRDYKQIDQRNSKKGLVLFLITGILTSTFVAVVFFSLPSHTAQKGGFPASKAGLEGLPAPAPPSIGPQIAEAETEFGDKNYRKVNVVLEKGDTLYQSLLDKNVKNSTIHTIIKHLEPMIPCTTIMPGDTFVLTLDPKDNLSSFEYSAGPIETYIVKRETNGKFNSFKKKVELEKYWTVISGEVKNSLFKSIATISKDATLAGKFADIFVWKIDFHNEPRKGDKFRMVVEKYLLKGKFVRYGDILAAEYNGSCGLHQAVLFTDSSEAGDYYDLQGVSLRRAFLRTPLRFNYISSGYSYHRLHPILGSVRPHLGIDYAAPQGTPVWSVADGVVVSASHEGGNGKQVIIRHMNGYKTYYNHLSRFGKDIKKNVRVRQKQVIGYVGTTGLSTGPHLDYRVKHHSKFINPLKTDFPTGQKLELTSKKAFNQLAYNLLHFMYDKQKEKWICKVMLQDQKTAVE